MSPIYAELASLFTKLLSPSELIKMLPIILNLTQIVMTKGEGRLSPETALFIQTEIEKARLLL